jgi:AmmeMemoRadiSam system protein B
MRTLSDIRPSPIAGQWYSDSPALLAKSVDDYLAAAQLPPLAGQVVAVIAPHAGHIYSGPVAGYAFRAVQGLKFDLAVVISPLHQYAAQPLLTSAHKAYATPLGAVMIDAQVVTELDAALKETLGYGLLAAAYDREHSLEIELPFLQRALAGEFKLLPVMVRDPSPEVTHPLGLALAKVLRGKSALLVASTDLSHFYSEREAERLDSAMLEQIAAFSPEGVYAAEATGKGYACGLGAVMAVLWAARELGADHVEVLHHATSGAVTGDYASVVGYGAAVITRTIPALVVHL